MKKIVLLFCCAGLLTACNNATSNQENSDHATDSVTITRLADERDSLMSLIGEINQGILEINEMEHVIVSPNFQQETPERKSQIMENINAMRMALEKRRTELDKLERKMKQAGKMNADLQETIDTQKQMMTQQAQKILELQRELNSALATISNLNSSVDSLNNQVTNINSQREEAEKRSADLANELNTCYYVVGSNKELKEHSILEKKFLSHTKVLEGNFDRSYFTRAYKRTLREIETFSERAKILTKQPVNSYRIEERNGSKVIVITNSTLFWEKSDYLVIEVK